MGRIKSLRYQLIVSDLDGTLLHYGTDRLSAATREAIAAWQGHGVQFTLATGRSWLQTKPVIQQLKIKVPVILQSGAVIFDPLSETVLKLQLLRPGIDQQLRQLPDRDGVDCFGLAADGGYFTSRINSRGGRWLLEKSSEPCRLVEKPQFEAGRLVKRLYIGNHGQLQELLQLIQNSIKPQPNLILWPPEREERDWFLEVFDPRASKGQALRWLAKRLRVPLRRVMAIGDGHNDLDILKQAGLGVAIAAAPAVVRSNAGLIIPGPEADGVACFLNETLAAEDAKRS